MTKINGSICIITGAASGIGRQLAHLAAQRGAQRVIATDINPAGLEETVLTAAEQGWRLESAVFDTGSPEQVNEFVEQIVPSLAGGRLVLVNNAGIALCSGRFQDTSMEDFSRLLEINLMGVLRLTKGFYPYLISTNQGHIVNLSSVFGFAGVDGNAAYCTSKFAVRGFSESLRMELLNSNVRVTCVHPGGIKTDIVRNAKPAGQVMTEEKYQVLVDDFDRLAKTTAQQAANAILSAVERNQSRLVIGRDGRHVDWMTRLFPTLYTQLLMRHYRRKMMNPYDA